MSGFCKPLPRKLLRASIASEIYLPKMHGNSDQMRHAADASRGDPSESFEGKKVRRIENQLPVVLLWRSKNLG